MPYYQGNLSKIISQAQPLFLPLETTIMLITQISDALLHLHRLGIVHGDITPSNILYTTFPSLKFFLTDFGNSFDEISIQPTQTLPYRPP